MKHNGSWKIYKSTKKIECSQYKSITAKFSPSLLPLAPFIFSKNNWVIPGHVLHS
jgi:hypothetical protein